MTVFQPKHTDPDNVDDRGKVERVKLSGSGDSNEVTEWVPVPVLTLPPDSGDDGKAPAYNDSTGTFDLVSTVTVPLAASDGGVPSGGSTGQVLKKNSGTDYDYSWAADATAGGGGAIIASDTLWDTKGDLAVATAADTASKLAAGSNGQALLADSAASTGLSWQWTVPTVKPTSTCVQMTSRMAAANAAAINRCLYVPLWATPGHAYTNFGCRVGAASSSGVLRVGIYAPTSGGLPGTLITDGGTVASTSTGARWVSISYTAKTPVLWVAICPQTDVTSLTLYASNNNSGWSPMFLGTPSNGEAVGCYYEDSVSAGLPSTATPTGPGTWQTNVTAFAY